MKIIHVTHLYHPSQGGVQFFFKNISERLVKDYGDDVTVVTTNSVYGPERKIFKSAGPQQEVINGVKVIRFPFTRWHLKPYSFMAKAFKKLSLPMPDNWKLLAYGPNSSSMKKYLMNVKADAICASSSNYSFMQLPLWRKCNFFYFGSIHFTQDATKKTLFKKQVNSINASTLYLANTTFEIERLVQSGVHRDKIYVLGVGVDMEPFLNVADERISGFKTELELPYNALVIGYVGRIEVTKNILIAIKAFERIALEFENVYLLIAGSGNDYVQTLKTYCEKLPEQIASRIKWQINFSSDKKTVIFNAIDMLVLPSNNESFGIVFLEAWSCKKPVIGASIGAVSDVISDGVDGLLMRINDELNLAQKLKVLIKDEELRKQMGASGFEKVKRNYTWDIIVSKIRACYLKDQIVLKQQTIHV